MRILFLLLISFSLSAQQAVFHNLISEGSGIYVSYAGGGDGSSPAIPMSMTDFEALTLVDDDKVYFKRGDTFLELDKSITSIHNLTFRSYGSGAEPVFTGSIDVGGLTWTNEGSGFYSASIATDVLWVFINGVSARQGESNWIPITSAPSSTTRGALTATLNAFNSVESLVGAKLRCKEFPWIMSFEKNISGYNSGTGVITTTETFVGSAVNMPFKLYGQKQFCTLEGDWYYDPAANKLWVFTSVSPSGTDIRVTHINTGLTVTDCNNFTIEDIEFKNYYRAALKFDGTDATVNNVTIHDIRTDGIVHQGNKYLNISGGTDIYNCGLNGITNGAMQNSFIEATIHDIGEDLNMPWPIDTYFLKTGGTGIATSPDTGETIKLPANNSFLGVMYNLGYCGMLMLGDNWSVTNSTVHTFLTRFNDGGGLYSFYRADLGPGESTAGGLIQNVIIYGGVGVNTGIVSPEAVSAPGVYIDNGSNNWEIRDCLIYGNTLAGVFSNWGTEETKIYDCTIYNNSGYGNVIFSDLPGNSFPYDRNKKNILSGNSLIQSVGQYAVASVSQGGSADGSYNPFDTGGSSDNNRYISRYKENLDSDINRFSSTSLSAGYTNYDLAEWRTRNSVDAASTFKGHDLDFVSPVTPTEIDFPFFPNETNAPVFHDLTNGLYTDRDDVNINDVTSPAHGVSYAFIKPLYYPLMDGFVNTIGTNMSGKAPTAGNNAIVASGTHSTISGFEMSSSADGLVLWNTGVSDDFAYQVKARVTNASSVMRMDVRLQDDAGSPNNRIILDFSGGNIRLREFFASATATQTLTSAFTLSTTSNYVIRIEVRGAEIKAYVKTDSGADTLYHTMTTSLLTGDRVGVLGQTTRRTDFVVVYPIN